jgi:hypothetical protein
MKEPRESLPRDLSDTYPRMIDDWVFSHFGTLLGEQGTSDATGSPTSGQLAVEVIVPARGPQANGG